MRQRLHRLANAIRRGIGHAGPDRDVLLLVFKSALAATIAWLIADQLLQAPSATFAPFSALLMVQVTVARSLFQSLRYATAVIVGVALTGAVIPLLGATLWTFAALLLIALIIGRWPKLGSQGSQVAVAALFAYSAFATSTNPESSLTQLFSIAGLVVLGCAIGVLTNLVIVPPLRYRSAEYGVSVLSQSLCDLLSDMDRGLRDGVPDKGDAQEWARRADRLPGAVAQARDTVEHAAETMRFNPRRLVMRGSSSFDGYRAIINALQRASEQLCSISKGLERATQRDDPTGPQHERFLHGYAELLERVAGAATVLGSLHTTQDLRDEDQLDRRMRECEQAYQELAQHADTKELDDVYQWPVFDGLHTDAHRIVQEFLQAQHELAELVQEKGQQPQDSEVASTPSGARSEAGK